MVSFYRYLFRRLWTISVFALRYRGADCSLYAADRGFAVGSADGLFAVFFRSAGFYTAISCQTRDKLTDISVDCVVSMPYRSVRKKKERNKKYYACNSEQLKARGISLYEEDPCKKKAAAQAYYDAHREERKASFNSYYDAHREERKASTSSYYEAHREERKASFNSYYNAHREERKASTSSYYEAHREERKASFNSYYDAHREERKASTSS